MPGSITNWMIGAGIALIIIGLIAKTGVLSWFGQLPGDIRIEREGFQFYFPLMSMILISVVLSALVAVVRRFLWVYPGFPTVFWGLSGFFVGDLRKRPCGSSWKTRSVFQGAVGASCASTAPSASTGPVRVRQDGALRGEPCVMSNWTAASSDCSRHYVHIKTADLYRPHARFIPERQ